MTRYYTVCDFTPLYRQTKYHRDKYKLYSKAPGAFLFHDTEETLSVTDITRPIFHLANLFDEDAKEVLVLRVNPKTLVCTFSLNGFPKPIVHVVWSAQGNYREAWLDKHSLTGWVIRDARNPATTPLDININDIYDSCEALAKLAGACPCEKLSTGECARDVVLPHLPPDITVERLRSDYLIDPTTLRRSAYKRIADFHYISPRKTTSDDFSEAMRAWDDHDFSLVDERHKELSLRGKRRHLLLAFRKDKCKTCAFNTIGGKGAIQDCGEIHSCQGGISEETAWTQLFAWLYDSKFMDMPGFTEDQRNFLIQQAGLTTKARCISAARKTKVVLAGFVLRSHPVTSLPVWQYRVAANATDYTRCATFSTYSMLREAIPELPENPTGSTLNPKINLACALLGTVKWIYQPYKGRVEPHSVIQRNGYVELRSAVARYIAGSVILSVDDPVTKFYKVHWRCSDAAKNSTSGLKTPYSMY